MHLNCFLTTRVAKTISGLIDFKWLKIVTLYFGHNDKNSMGQIM